MALPRLILLQFFFLRDDVEDRLDSLDRKELFTDVRRGPLLPLVLESLNE